MNKENPTTLRPFCFNEQAKMADNVIYNFVFTAIVEWTPLNHNVIHVYMPVAVCRA